MRPVFPVVFAAVLLTALLRQDEQSWDEWWKEHVKTCEVCAGGDNLCEEAYERWLDALDEYEREKQRRRTKPDGMWHPKPTRAGVWWKHDRATGEVSSRPTEYVQMEDGGLGLEVVGRSITNWGNADYYEQDLTTPASFDDWLKPLAVRKPGIYLNWQDRGYMQVVKFERWRLRLVTPPPGGSTPRDVGGLFFSIDPPQAP